MATRPETSSRTWWSKLPIPANARPDKSSRQGLQKSSGLSFNSIASAIGLKPKKHPSLAIQSPPPPPVKTTTGTDASEKYISRPSSKSLSSLDPRKPMDGRKNTRQSLLMVSDADPFVSARHPSDPNRLSVHSNSSTTEVGSKHRGPSKLNRISSSSNSTVHHESELSPTSSNQSSTLAPDSPIQNLKPTRSVGSLHRKRSILPPDGSLVSAWDNLSQGHQATLSKADSSSTLTDKYRVNLHEYNPRLPPWTGPRALTDGRASHNDLTYSPNASVTNSPVPTSSPRVIVRQASTSRIGSPPSAPPKHGLPPPPLAKDDVKDNVFEAVQVPSASSGSSSSLSFASPVSSNKDVFVSPPHSPRLNEKGLSEQASPSPGKHGAEHSNTISKASQSTLTTPRPLKKALSHQSLAKRGSSPSSPAPAPVTLPPERIVEKVPRKQRSFHQPKGSKFSMPPIRHTHSSGSQSASPVSDGVPPNDQRKDSTSGIHTPSRKRLFSGSNLRRPSTAQHFLSEDDSLSVLSMRSEQEQASSFVSPASPSTSFSFWDEGTHDHALDSPRHVTHEYTPQQIMSPAEMAKVEASVEESSIYERTRDLSLLSASSDAHEPVIPDSPSPLTWHGGTSTGLPQRSNSLFLTGLTGPRQLAARPSTSDANVAVSSTHLISFQSPSPPQVMTSLPPPPRRGPRPSLVAQAPPEDDFSGGLPLPPVRRSLRPKVSVEKVFHRQSIIRKPSFLEIDDDTDKETDGESSGEPLNGSFLDLARESFDTND